MSSYADDWGFASNGNPGREEKLVASKLVGFRRFGFDSASQSLTAVSDRSFFAAPGENTAEHRGLLWSAKQHMFPDKGVVPIEGCTCGFYGYYTPELIDNTFNSNAWTCCAVVEAWGKVILGTKGFRAEKMRILGVVLPAEILPLSASEFKDIPSLNPYHYGDLTPVIESVRLRCLYEYRQAWRDTVQRYGVTEYATVEDMVAAHPPQDVSHLLPKPVEKPLPVTDGTAQPRWSASLAMWPGSSYTTMPPWMMSAPTPVYFSQAHYPNPGDPLPADHKAVFTCPCHWCEGVRAFQRLAQRALKENE